MKIDAQMLIAALMEANMANHPAHQAYIDETDLPGVPVLIDGVISMEATAAILNRMMTDDQ